MKALLNISMVGIISWCGMLTTAAYGTSTFSFHNQSSYIDENKIYHLYGEIRNDSNESMNSIVISAIFKDPQGRVLGNYSGAPALRTLGPGETSGFEMMFLNSTSSNSIQDYVLSTVGRPAQGEVYALTILSSDSRLDLLGTYYINALVQNNAPQNATNSVMVATLYDKNGNVIAIGKALAEASPGSADIPAGARAAFGIAITDKLQTYKTAWYTLVAESDQFLSNKILLTPGNSTYVTSAGATGSKSGCLIATAAYGSALAPEVQQLRTFRDNIVMSTISGSDFMQAFNIWYYSFSPSVADEERRDPLLQMLVRWAIQPLLATLRESTAIQAQLSSIPEGAIIVTGVFASATIGLVYLGPIAFLIGALASKKKLRLRPVAISNISSWILGLSMILLSLASSDKLLGLLGTSLLVLSSILVPPLVLVWIFKSRTLRWPRLPQFPKS